ncbi:MAG: hypothetical protein K2N16_08320 [Muribaculaceae bacterium]|nr:hypothetical protein [Muribaculaceae bacterium]
MKATKFLAIASSILAIASTSCIDDKYDLSDIDTTVQVKIDRLVVPVNIDQIFLSSVIDETSNIKVIDGHYAYVTDGTFNSDPISIDGISVKIDDIQDSHVTIKNALGGMPNPDVDIDYDIHEANPTEYSFKAEDISENLCGLTRINGKTTFTIKLDLSGIKNFASKAQLMGVKIMLTKHMIVKPNANGTYDYESGIFTLKDQLVDTSAGLTIEIEVEAIEIAAGEFNEADHTIDISGEVGVTDGIFRIPAQYQSQTLPEMLSLVVSYDIADFEVESVSGELQYPITDVDIPEVELNDIPDFLNQPGTNLILANPQLYLNANNPLNMYKDLYAETGIEITAKRVGESGTGIDKKTFTLDQPFKIGGEQGVNEFNYVLAPEDPATTDAGYPHPTFVKFSSLGHILSGNGLPKALQINLVDPMVPKQPIENFLVDKKYEAIKGTWKFVAPFDLASGSCIMYSDVVDGWSSEDLDHAVITFLEVNVTVSTDIPVGVQFTGAPLGKDGNAIAGTKITGATIKPMADNEHVTILVEMPEGGIHNLDGIKFEAVATAADGQALSPAMTIRLTNIRPCVSGYYEKEL